ncbi:MAG TPA: aminoacyl-tRNA hydrolase [Patescibacteria group bacterium]|nr:aminoacyl-tRNA hydrolase [Patescibacteria group bacterium]
MKVIVGLGNPGEKYHNTRHNLGFMVLDQLIEKLEPAEKTFWEDERQFKAEIKKIKLKNDERQTTSEELLLVKPTTFMNNSGFAVSKVISFYKVKPEDVIVIHDELDLPFGKIRVRFGGGAGGHHGVESVIEHIGDKFLRIRLGIGTDKEHETRREYTDEYVLGNLSSHDKGKAKTMIKQAIKDVELVLKHGIDNYMSKYNK